jgi:pSer/pThr/pTyr-binding forkhead associated (FHA) protein
MQQMMMEVHVVNAKSGEMLRAFALGDEAEVIIGRDTSCDICITSPSVSREHCVIEQLEGEFVIRDLGSTGGTLQGGHRIEQLRVEEGLEIQVGPTLLRFHDSGY